MSCPCEFPESIPWGCVREVIRIVRGGVVTEIPALMRACGCLLGSCGNMFANDHNGYGSFNSDKTLDQIMDELGDMSDDGCGGATLDYIRSLILDMVSKVFDWLKGD